MWIGSTVVACRDLWSNQVVSWIRASGHCWFYSPPGSAGGDVMQAFWGVCFVMLAQGQFGRIACDSRQMTDVNLIQQGPKRWLLFMTQWTCLHNMLLITCMHAACAISDYVAVVFVLFIYLFFNQITFDETEEVWKCAKILLKLVDILHEICMSPVQN